MSEILLFILAIIGIIAIIKTIIKFGIVIGTYIYNKINNTYYILKAEFSVYKNETFGIIPAIELSKYEKSITILYHWFGWNYCLIYELFDDNE